MSFEIGLVSLIHLGAYFTLILNPKYLQSAFITQYFSLTKEGAGISQFFINFWLKFLCFLIARSLPTKEIFYFHTLHIEGEFC